MNSTNAPDEGAASQPLAARWCRAFEEVCAQGEAALPAFLALYGNDIHFKDPVQEARGLEAFEEVNRRFVRGARRLEVRFGEVVAQGEGFCVAWTLRFAPRLGPTVTVEGLSHVRAEGGRIVHHRDYFDVVGTGLGAVPGLGAVYRRVMSRLV